jgi:hypothetical protein
MIQIIVETTEYETSEQDPEDSWDRADTTMEVVGVSAIRVSDRVDRVSDRVEVRRGWYGNDTFDVEPNERGLVYAVIARYSTGDTFGRDDGRVQVMDVFDNNEEAAALTEALECSEHDKSEAVVNFELKHGGREYYLPWVGYFEHLENVDVHPLRVS